MVASILNFSRVLWEFQGVFRKCKIEKNNIGLHGLNKADFIWTSKRLTFSCTLSGYVAVLVLGLLQQTIHFVQKIFSELRIYLLIFFTSFSPLLCPSIRHTCELSFVDPRSQNVDLHDIGNLEGGQIIFPFSILISYLDVVRDRSGNITVKGSAGLVCFPWEALAMY